MTTIILVSEHYFFFLLALIRFTRVREETNQTKEAKIPQTNRPYKNTKEGEKGTDTKERIFDAGTGAVILSYAPTMHYKYL